MDVKQIMIGKRVFSDPQRFAVCSPDSLPIKEYYKDVFEEIFVFYHPFIKPESIDYELFKPDTYPNRNEIRENCVVVTWKQFLKLSGIESFRKLDMGLRTNINGLRVAYQDENIARMIQMPPNRLVSPITLYTVHQEINNLCENSLFKT